MTSYEMAKQLLEETPQWILDIVKAELEKQRRERRLPLQLVEAEEV